MHRISSSPRPGWQQAVRTHGMAHLDTGPGGVPRWDESACYVLDLSEVLRLEAVTAELHEMCLAAARHVLAAQRHGQLGVPDWAAPALAATLAAGAPELYGRLDLCYDGTATPKLLGYHTEEAGGLVESAIVQWYWLDQAHPDQDQWNSLHDRLVAGWQAVAARAPDRTVHFCWSDLDPGADDLVHLGYFAETARQAGMQTRLLPIRMIGWDGQRFVDDLTAPITTCFKLYPWEWMLQEPYGRLALDPRTSTVWLEPAWKMLLSSPGLMAVLWELFPGHPNLLPSYLDLPRQLRDFVARPLARTPDGGARVIRAGTDPAPPGCCYQELCPLPSFSGHPVVLHSWVVSDGQGRAQPAGAGFRESTDIIPEGAYRFVPHVVSR